MDVAKQQALMIEIENQQSLVHLGSLDSFDITEGGKKAARLMKKYLKEQNPAYLEKAIDLYEDLIPNENFGGEYTALEWICRFWISPEEIQKQMLSSPLVYSFWHELSDNDYDNLKTYLDYKYHFVEYKKDQEQELQPIHSAPRAQQQRIISSQNKGTAKRDLFAQFFVE